MAHQRNRWCGGRICSRSHKRQQVTMLSTPPERLSTIPTSLQRYPKSLNSFRRSSTKKWPWNREMSVAFKGLKKEIWLSPFSWTQVAYLWHLESRTETRGNTFGLPAKCTGLSLDSAFSRYASTAIDWIASCVSSKKREQSSFWEFLARALDSSLKTASNIVSESLREKGSRACRSTRDKKQISGTEPNFNRSASLKLASLKPISTTVTQTKPSVRQLNHKGP